MNSSTNTSAITNYFDYYIVCSLSATFGLISISVSTLIIVIVQRTKPRLHTIRHLLMCNTCISSTIYCIVQFINYIFLIFLPWIISDVACRWRGYFAYASVTAATYSYLVQAVSRLFFSVYSGRYPWLTTFNVHYLLILAHWLIIFIIPLPALITTDIYFRPGLLCWVPFKHTLHMAYTVIACYVTPIISIFIIYVVIYRRIRKAKKAATMILNGTHDKRDLEVLRNIVILLCVYIAGGIPTILFMITEIELFYLASIVTFTLTVAIEKICTILLDRDLRPVVKGLLFKTDRIMPYENTCTRMKMGNV
ncbi:unnamed protein product [Adineta ricciae]|uniref:G-protein coupled receptors family 1 profile domain-containing protein n=1 Tax=Adineta ricciae TaxID=249248 RepID=A0A814RX47_ADIRI|nr:unnamed protein product [Adineta ricciae]CAF1139132.1 unnamed protein product [Adineta ricciae]